MFEAVVARLRMRPMSLHETGHSTGTISLKALLASSLGPCSDPGLTIQDVAIRVAVGGWPRSRATWRPRCPSVHLRATREERMDRSRTTRCATIETTRGSKSMPSSKRPRVCGRPATLAVIVAAGYGYVRPDGVAVVPIGALAP